jgi:hypothetical protein
MIIDHRERPGEGRPTPRRTDLKGLPFDATYPDLITLSGKEAGLR